MYKKRFLALVLALLMLCLTACMPKEEGTTSANASNTLPGTGSLSSSDPIGTGIPENSDHGTTEQGPQGTTSDATTETGPEQPSQPAETTENTPPIDTPDTNTNNGPSDVPTNNGTVPPPANSDTPSGGNSGNADSSSGNGGSVSEQKPNPGTNDNPSVPVTTPNRYGRTWLAAQTNGAQLVKAYEEIAAGIESMKEEIPITADISTSEISKVWLCCRDDYPEHFWVGNNYSYSHKSNNKVTSVTPTYSMNATQKAAAQTNLESQITALLNGLHGGMSQYDLEKAIHDRLVLHTSYVNVDFCHTAYGALVNRQAVCDGYTKAFQILCHRMGIEALFVRGQSDNPTTGTPEGHAWNIVKIDGDYYHIDVTWDDAGEPTAENIHYGWFNVPTSQIKLDHVIQEEGYEVPNCTATAQNYYRKNNAWLSTLTVDGLVNATKKEGNAFVCKAYVENPGDIEAWFNTNIDALAERYGLNGYHFSITMAGNEIHYRFE